MTACNVLVSPVPCVAFDCRGGFADRGRTFALGWVAELSPLTRDEVSGQRLRADTRSEPAISATSGVRSSSFPMRSTTGTRRAGVSG